MSVKNKAAEISIFDEIGGWGISVQQFKEAFDLVKDQAEIKLFINSPGGSIIDGMALYNLLSSVRNKLTVEIIGLAASMASIVALAGKDRPVMAEGTYLMIHNPWTVAIGDAEEMKKNAEILDKMKGELVNIYAAKSALTPEEISSMMDEETWLTAQEAVDMGLASEVKDYGQLAAMVSSNRFDLKKIGFNKLPEELKNYQAEKPAIQEGNMDPKNEPAQAAAQPAQAAQAQAPAVQQPVAQIEITDKLIEVLAERTAPAIAKLLPAGRVLESRTRDDKFPGWFLDALRGKNISRGIPQNAAGTIVTSDGFGIPVPAMAEVLTNLNFYSIARRWGALARGVTAPKTKATINVVQNSAEIIAEKGDYPDLGEPDGIEVDLVKLGGRYSMSEEADEDSIINEFETFQREAAVALAKAENHYFLVGDGTGEPKGIFAESATKTCASSSTITLAELLELDESIADEWDTMEQFDPRNPGAYRGPIYVMKGSTAAVIRAMKDADSKYIFQEYYSGKMLTMFGRPVVRSSYAPAIGAGNKVIALVNWAGYVIGERRPALAMKITEDPDNHNINWDFNERIDGKTWNTDAVKILAMKAST